MGDGERDKTVLIREETMYLFFYWLIIPQPLAVVLLGHKKKRKIVDGGYGYDI